MVTAVAILATATVLDPFPTHGAEEADVVDDAFFALTYMASPVFGLVVAVLVYSILRFRSSGQPTEDGPAIFGQGAVPAQRTWRSRD